MLMKVASRVTKKMWRLHRLAETGATRAAETNPVLGQAAVLPAHLLTVDASYKFAAWEVAQYCEVLQGVLSLLAAT